jgi:hypothetical protein
MLLQALPAGHKVYQGSQNHTGFSCAKQGYSKKEG